MHLTFGFNMLDENVSQLAFTDCFLSCKLPSTSIFLLLFLQRGSYLLVADFHTYNNSLHSFVNTSASPFTSHCCDGRDAPDCTDPCNTVLNYCFKEVGAVNSFANDSTVLRGCMTGGGSLTELVERTDNIDFSKPPLSVSGAPTRRSLSNRGPLWPVSFSHSYHLLTQLPIVLCNTDFGL